MLKLLLLVIILLPIIELTLIFKLGMSIGWAPTLLVVFGTGLAGAAVARLQGWRAAMQMRQQLQQGVMPAAAVLDGLLIVVAGVLLILPGVLSDVAGVALLFPVVRTSVRRGLVGWLHQRFRIEHVATGRGETGGQPQGDKIIDARVIETRVVD